MRRQKGENMKQFDFVVQASVGIHARPAMMLVSVARNFESNIEIFYNGNIADAKNIVKLLMLHANQGAKVTFLIEGDDEEEACNELQKFCEINL